MSNTENSGHYSQQVAGIRFLDALFLEAEPLDLRKHFGQDWANLCWILQRAIEVTSEAFEDLAHLGWTDLAIGQRVIWHSHRSNEEMCENDADQFAVELNQDPFATKASNR